MNRPDEDLEPGAQLDPDERDPEAAPEDGVEQARPADPRLEEDERVPIVDEVNEWDAIEQARVVLLDDDGV